MENLKPKIIYLDKAVYDSSSHDSNTIYVVDGGGHIKLHYREMEVSNIIRSNTLEGAPLNPDCFYIIGASSQVSLYYSYWNEDTGEKYYIPLMDSSVTSISSDSEGYPILVDKDGSSYLLVTLDDYGSLKPDVVYTQILNSLGALGVIDLRPDWKNW